MKLIIPKGVGRPDFTHAVVRMPLVTEKNQIGFIVAAVESGAGTHIIPEQSTITPKPAVDVFFPFFRVTASGNTAIRVRIKKEGKVLIEKWGYQTCEAKNIGGFIYHKLDEPSTVFIIPFEIEIYVSEDVYISIWYAYISNLLG